MQRTVIGLVSVPMLLAALLLTAQLPLSAAPPAQVKPQSSSPDAPDWNSMDMMQRARWITGLVSVHHVYEKGYCAKPQGVKILVPRVVGHSYDVKDPIFQIYQEMGSWVGTWIGLMLQGGDAAGKAAAGEPWYQAPVCVGVMDDVGPNGQAAANAFATSDRNILFGWRMYNKVVQGGFHGNRTAGLVYVLAHEFGHYLQFRSHLTFSNPTAVVQELQADCLAGYTMGLTRIHQKDQAGFLGRTFELASALGDQAVYDPDHHGTPEQRVQALKAGYVASARDASSWISTSGLLPLKSSYALRACIAYPADQQRVQHLRPLIR